MGVRRLETGNTLAMIAVAAIVFIVVVGFILLYLSMLRSNTEHKSAIEAAAIAAAKDVGRIVVDTPEWGFVALTSEPPIGNDTKTLDNWDQQVHSVNELMATSRLNMIIADELGDNFMKNLALQDLAAVKTAKDALVAEIQQALTSTGTAKDAAGNTLSPYNSALQAYTKNQAKNSTYVAGSLALTLGGLQGGIPTGTPAPTPLSKGACSGLEAEGHYLSETNIPFQGTNFVFGSVGKRVSLCDKDKFTTTVSGVAFQMPSVVQAVAQQQFQDQGKTWTTNFTACACAGSLESQRPQPGALTISFPDGPVPELGRPGDLYSNLDLQKSKMEVYTAASGDFIVDSPTASLAPYVSGIPFPANPPAATDVSKLAFYDWIRCGGSKVNIDSVVNMQSLDFNDPSTPEVLWRVADVLNPPALKDLGMVPTGVMHIYTFTPTGTVAYKSIDLKPAPYTVVGENQIYAEMQDSKGFKSSVKDWTISDKSIVDAKGNAKNVDIKGKAAYDLYVRDLSRQLGGTRGGKHGGERMDGNPLISTLYGTEVEGYPAYDDEWLDFGAGGRAGGPSGPGTTTGNSAGAGIPPMITRQDDFASTSVPLPNYYVYSQGPAGGGPRPAYAKNALAADIRFRRQVDVGAFASYLGNFKTGYIGEMK